MNDAIHDRFDVVEEQNRIRDPDALGYRAILYLVRVEGQVTEIQLHTLRGTLWANASHVLFYKGPFRSSNALGRYLEELSDAIYRLDSGIRADLPPLPSDLPAGATVVLEHTLSQIAMVEALNPLDPFHITTGVPSGRGFTPTAANAASQELRRLERELLESAGIAADERLLNAFESAEHYALDDFGELQFDWQDSRRR